jgi:hypothetical protein
MLGRGVGLHKLNCTKVSFMNAELPGSCDPVRPGPPGRPGERLEGRKRLPQHPPSRAVHGRVAVPAGARGFGGLAGRHRHA